MSTFQQPLQADGRQARLAGQSPCHALFSCLALGLWSAASLAQVSGSVQPGEKAFAPAPAGGAGLRAQYEALATQLARSPFQRSLVLISGSSSSEPSGDVYAVVEHPFRHLSAALQRAEDWCGILILPSNVKRCAAGGLPPRQHIQLAVGRKFDQPASEAYPIDFQFAVQAARPEHLQVEMRADNGPMGTRSYRLTLEAVPLGAARSFVHMSYAYANGLAARVATDAYWATVGRDKVGFSVTGQD
eukprot:gene9405-12715_t